MNSLAKVRLVGVVVCKPVCLLQGSEIPKSRGKEALLFWANGRLPWSVPAEQKHFWDTVENKPVIMGTTTFFDDFGKLDRAKYHANRVTVVISRKRLSLAEAGACVQSSEPMLDNTPLADSDKHVLQRWGFDKILVESESSNDHIAVEANRSAFRRLLVSSGAASETNGASSSSGSRSRTVSKTMSSDEFQSTEAQRGELVWLNGFNKLRSGMFDRFLFAHAEKRNSVGEKQPPPADANSVEQESRQHQQGSSNSDLFLIGGAKTIDTFMDRGFLHEMCLSTLKPHVPLLGMRSAVNTDGEPILFKNHVDETVIPPSTTGRLFDPEKLDVVDPVENDIIVLSSRLFNEWETAVHRWEKLMEKDTEDFTVFRYRRKATTVA